MKNCVFNLSVDTKKWAKASAIRCVKTMSQTALSLFTIGQVASEIDWKIVVSASLVAGIYSILTSIAGIPEVESGE